MRVGRQARVDVDEVERILVAVARTTGSSDARTTRRTVSRTDEVDAAAEEVVVEAVAVVDAMVDVTAISPRMRSSTAATSKPPYPLCREAFANILHSTTPRIQSTADESADNKKRSRDEDAPSGEPAAKKVDVKAE
jgi:hypothetical protein